MGKNSNISWTDHTWNPWVGCSKVSAGCQNCYMFRDQKRWGNDPTELRRTKDKTFYAIRHWEPSRIFVCSWSDFFHEEVSHEWREEALDLMFGMKKHTFLLLTKRLENVNKMIPEYFWDLCPHAWLGATIEDDEAAGERIPLLLEIPAAMKFVSCEPLLGPINFYYSLLDIDWVIVGGESGNTYRDINPEWARDIRDTCQEFNTAFFMKQMSGNTKAQREAIPDDLMIREFPDVD